MNVSDNKIKIDIQIFVGFTILAKVLKAKKNILFEYMKV